MNDERSTLDFLFTSFLFLFLLVSLLFIIEIYWTSNSIPSSKSLTMYNLSVLLNENSEWYFHRNEYESQTFWTLENQFSLVVFSAVRFKFFVHWTTKETTPTRKHTMCIDCSLKHMRGISIICVLNYRQYQCETKRTTNGNC